MLLDTDYTEIGNLKSPFDSFINHCYSTNWTDEKFNRQEISLKEGRLCVLPYVIKSNVNSLYSGDQKKLIILSEPIIDEVMSFFPNFIKIRGEIVNLLPGKELTLHKDIYWFHKNSKRIHIPILTNDQCKQIFEDREYHFKVGKIYEINNRIFHSAKNLGNSNRIHIILDLMNLENYKKILKNKNLAMQIENET